MFIAKEINRTHLTLIPKKKVPEKVFDYRPISFCNVSCKSIFKLLANRLRTVLPKIISPLQSAFATNKDIHDDIFIAHEILTTFSKNHAKGGYMAIKSWPIKLHMEKTYDRLAWNFIKKWFNDLFFFLEMNQPDHAMYIHHYI